MSIDRPPPSAVVTGSASGLGRALAVRLAQDGWRLALADLNERGNRETLALVERAGGQGRLEHLDVTQSDQWRTLAQRLQLDWPQLDLLINNAGVAGSGEVGRFPLDDWRWLLEVNVMGAVYGCHTLIDWLVANPKGGHIMITASLAGICSAPTLSAYNLSKAAMISLAETLYAERRKDGLGVTVICPGFFQTNLLQAGRFETDEQRQVGENSMVKARFTAADVADRAVRAMHARRLYVFVPARARWLWRLKRWIPRTFARIVARAYARGLPETV